MTRQTLNEERGARDAAELKRRFHKVSSRSKIGGRSRLFTGGGLRPVGPSHGKPMGIGKAIVVWLMIGLIAFAIGSFIR
ncbi:hypothetical protein [Roseibium algae]|uniref:Stress-associated endoplasmic reticulum protein n=1 Tax=Roseibium algae TaxID=3123038 RepID=A0ABU8THE0_9HYPH